MSKRYNDHSGSKTILYKFVIFQTKNLVCDAEEYPIYMDAFDRVIFDLYGLEDFSRRMSRCRSNRTTKELIDRIGLEQLVNLLKNPIYCNILRDLMNVVNDVNKIAKKIKKNRNKGESTKKYVRDEYDDLIKLYKKGIKYLRKALKIRNIHKAYKGKYPRLRNTVGNSNRDDLYWDDFDFDNISAFSDDYDDPYDDMYGDEYDPDDSTILEDFMHEISGEPVRRNRRKCRSSFEYADDPEYDEEDDYEDEDEEYDELSAKVDNLCEHMQTLTDTVNGLSAQQRYDEANNRNTQTHRSNLRKKKATCSCAHNAHVNAGDSTKIDDIQVSISKLITVVNNVNERLKDVEDCIEESDDDDMEMTPIVNDSSFGNAYNSYDDPYANNRHMVQPHHTPPSTNRAQETASIIQAMNNANDLTQEMLDSQV